MADLVDAAQRGDAKAVCALLASGASADACDARGRTALMATAHRGDSEIVATLLASGASVDQAGERGTTALIVASSTGHVAVVQALLAHGADVHHMTADRYSALFAASVEGHTDVVQLLLDSDAQPNAVCAEDVTPLFVASKFGHVSVVHTLLEHGAQIEPSSPSPLFIASQSGHLSVVKALVTSRASVDLATSTGLTPLWAAAEHGHAAVVEELIANGACVDRVDESQGATPLHVATQNGHLDVVRTLIRSDADVNIPDVEGATPLHIAAQCGHLDIVRELVGSGASVAIMNKAGVSPLFEAAAQGYCSIVSELLEAGADVDASNAFGVTPLFMASQNGHLESVKALLDRGANVNRANASNASPLFIAAHDGHAAIVNVLLDAGADSDYANADGATPVYIAAQNGHLEAVQALVARGCCVDARANDGITPLYIAAQCGHASVVSALAVSGADVNAVDAVGVTPLFIAAQNGHLEAVKVLLQNEASVTARNRDGLTALHVACQHDDHGIAALLVASGADVDDEDPHGITPLIRAALNDCARTARALLFAGAQADKPDSSGTTALVIAARRGRIDIVEALLEQGASVDAHCFLGMTPLFVASHQGHHAVAKLLLDHEARVDQADSHGSTPLFMACTSGHHDVVVELLQRGARVESAVGVGAVPLIAASRGGHLDIVETLLEWNAVPAATDTIGCSALHVAAWSGHAGVVNALVRAGAPLDAVDEHGNTPLTVAAQQGHLAIVQRLIALGASIEAVNRQGETALTVAAAAGQFDIVRALLDAGASVGARPLSGATCLISAAHWEHRETVSVLIKRGCFEPPDGARDCNGHVPLMAGTFQTLRDYVAYMPELASMWHGVVERLERLYTQLPRNGAALGDAVRPLLTLVFGLVKLKTSCEGTNVFTRLVMSRLIVKRLRDVYTELDDLATRLVASCPEHTLQPVHMDEERQRMVDAFQDALHRCSDPMIRTFQSGAEQVEALSLLQNELTTRADQYDDVMLALLRDGLKTVMQITGVRGDVAIPALPTWLIPSHELVVDDLHAALCRGPGSSDPLRAKWLSSDVMLMNVTTMFEAQFEQSVTKWHGLSHPSVLELYGGSHLRHPFVAVFEAVKSTNVCEYVASLTADGMASVVWSKLFDVALGLKFLHERGIVLGTLRCKHVWVTAHGVARINGFAVEEDVYDPEAVRWMAPECVRGERATMASDIYALGMCILEAASGGVPWGATPTDTVDWNVRTALLPRRPRALSKPQWRLIKSMCWADPTQRASITRVVEQLKHFQAAEAAQRHSVELVSHSICAASSCTDIAKYEFQELGTSIPTYLARLRAYAAQCHDHLDAAQCVLERLESIYSSLAKAHTAPEHVGVSAFCDALLSFHSFLRISATNVHSVLARAQSQRESLRHHVLHRELDHVLEVFAIPVAVDSVHNWRLRAPSSVDGADAPSDDEVDNASDSDHVVQIVRFETSSSAVRAFPPIELDRKPWFIPIYELKFRRDAPIGTGAFGVVYRGTWFSTPVVIKYMGRAGDAQGCRQELFLHELRVWYPLRHPHVARLYGASHTDKRYFVCEFVGNGTLRSYLQQATHRTKTWRMLHDVARGLAYLHAHNVLHNDLKCDNLLVADDGTVKIIDFGLSSLLESAEVAISAKRSGAPRWRSPEYLRGTERLTLASDVYAFGMCIIEAVSGEFPWGRTIDAAVRFQVLRKRALPPRPAAMSDAQWRLVRMMCAHEPRDRVDIASVADRLREFAEQEREAGECDLVP